LNIKSIKLIIGSSEDNIELLGMCIKTLSRYYTKNDELSDKIELAVVEAVNNVIEHAYSNQPNNLINAEFILNSNRIDIIVSDTGKTKPENIQPFLIFDENDLENLPEGGMGIFLINEIMDEVSYYTINGINFNKLTKYF
jgi:serine/threonine-protein kinase RsbW